MNKAAMVAGLVLSFVGGVTTPRAINQEAVQPLWAQCGTAQSGTNMQVWRIGENAQDLCDADANNAGWYTVGGGGGTINGDTVCWWTQDKVVTVVQDTGLDIVGTKYCQQNDPVASGQ